MHAIHRVIALLAVGVFGVAVLHVDTPHPSTVSAVVHHRVGRQLPLVVVHEERVVVHAPRVVKKKPAHHSVVRRHRTPRVKPFVPTGTGIWIYQWHRSDRGQAGKIVRRARWAGLSALYLRTGSSWDGFTAGRTLPSLLRATRSTDISVIAWDFPRLRHPGADALRLAHAAWIGRVGKGPHVAAVAPDIETPAEGTFNASWRVRVYLRVLRQHLPKGVTILSTVPWPSSYRRADYPYGTVAARSDVLVPMAYWYNNSPGYVTEHSIRYLRRFHKPVAPVGQGYDGKLDVPSLPHNNLSRQVPVFFRTAARAGARAVSIWSWQSAKPATWNALARAHRLFARGNSHSG